MSKIYGEIGYVNTVQTSPGVWQDVVLEPKRMYYGEQVRLSKRVQSSDGLNDNIILVNEISIVADPFANENVYAMRYFEYLGVKWKIASVEVRPPRIILSLGGVYNG